MIDGPDGEIALELLEGLFHLGELDDDVRCPRYGCPVN